MMTKLQHFMRGYDIGEKYAWEHSAFFFPFVFIIASVITIIVTIAVIPPLANLFLVASGCVSVLWGPQIVFGIKEMFYPSAESEEIHINPDAESEEMHISPSPEAEENYTMQSLDAQFDAVESVAEYGDQETVDERFIDQITYEIMSDPVKLNNVNFYVDRTTYDDLKKRGRSCPVSREKLTGYEEQPALKKEITSYKRGLVAHNDNLWSMDSLVTSPKLFTAGPPTLQQGVMESGARSSPHP